MVKFSGILRAYDTSLAKGSGSAASPLDPEAGLKVNPVTGAHVYSTVVDGVTILMVGMGGRHLDNAHGFGNEYFAAPLPRLRQSISYGGVPAFSSGHLDPFVHAIGAHFEHGSMEPLLEDLGSVLNRANANIRASAAKFVKTQLEKAPTTPYAAKKQTNDLTANLEEIVEAIVEKKFAERVLARAEEVAELPEVSIPSHRPGYESAVQAGADVRARIIAGPDMVSSMELGKLLGVTRETVNQRRQKGSLLSLTHGSRIQHYPTWQLERNVHEAMPHLLEALRQIDSWSQYFFITQGTPALDGRSPLSALRAGERDRVLSVAAEYADLMVSA